MLKNEIVELQKMIEDNPIGIINVLTEIIKQIEFLGTLLGT